MIMYMLSCCSGAFGRPSRATRNHMMDRLPMALSFGRQIINSDSYTLLGTCIHNSSQIYTVRVEIRPVHLLLRVLESNFPGDSLYNYMDMIIPTP